MKRLPGKAPRGLSLVETLIAIVISGFMFAFAGYLIFMVARNYRNVHEQIISQNNAAAAGERAATIMRSASRFAPWPSDADRPTTYSRIRVIRPGQPTAVLCYHPVKERIEYYEDESNVDFDGTHRVVTSDGVVLDCPVPTEDSEPTSNWPGQTAFFVSYESRYRVTLHLEYAYNGFALTAGSNLQRGRFVTDVIAKNHDLDKSEDNYEETSSTPALLY